MRKLIITAMAAAVAALSLNVDLAEARNAGFKRYHGHGWHHGRGWHHGHGWHNGHGWHHGPYHGYWGPGWGWGWGPTVVIGGPGYYGDCYIRKVRRHDANGHVYYRRVKVCD